MTSKIATSDAPRPGDAARRPIWPRFWLISLASLGFGSVIFLCVASVGFVSGKEFSPDRFQSRDFSYYEIPILHWQVTPIRRKTSTTEMERFLSQKQWLPVTSGAPAVWHLTQSGRRFGDPVPGDASLLTDPLNLRADGRYFWKTWSQSHPRSAVVAWRFIAKLAQRELYMLIPPLFEIMRGQQIDDAESMKQEFQENLKNEYSTLIDDMCDAGRHGVADALAREANQW